MHGKREKIIKEKSIIAWKIPAAEEIVNFSYLAKDNFWTTKFPTTASSNFLLDFLPGKDATVIKLLNKKKYFLLGKTALDELASAGTGLLANTGLLKNPHNSQHIPGGSSSGSAIVVAKNLAAFALGTDTGDSIRRPASYCGIVGFKPSYGVISRFGVIPMASSLDTVGILANSVATTQKIFSVIAEPDVHDLLTIASQKTKVKKISFFSAKKIAILADLEKYLSPQLVKLYQKTLATLKKEGYIVEKIKFPRDLRENLQTAYLILFSTELVNHLNSLQGITYGKRLKESESVADISQKIRKNRGLHLGKNLKQRLLMGIYFLQNPQYIQQAYRFRQKVSKWVDKLFQKYDFLLFPSTNSEAPKITDSTFFSTGNADHWSDNLMLLANFAGIPSLSLPLGFINNLPVGINLNAAYKQDKLLLQLAQLLEEKLSSKKEFGSLDAYY